MATLHPQLEHDCELLGAFTLCRVLLMRDANYPWLILVPDREGVREVYELDEGDQQQLMKESATLSRLLVKEFAADKMNIAALGNLVPQLHVHHVVRYRDDSAWPAPMWGRAPARPYSAEELQKVRERLLALLSGWCGFSPV